MTRAGLAVLLFAAGAIYGVVVIAFLHFLPGGIVGLVAKFPNAMRRRN